MRMLSLLTRFLPCSKRRPPGAEVNSSKILQLSFNRHADRHLAPLARTAVDSDASAHLVGTLTHADKPEVRALAVRLTLLIEAAAVVPDAEPHAAGVEIQVDDDRPCLRVPDGVVDGLLADAQEVVLDLRGERAQPHQAQSIELPREQAEAEGAQRVEPERAVEVRLQPEGEGGGRAAPDAVVVAGYDLEPVIARPQVRGISHAAVAAVNPIFVEAFEPVLVPHLLRRD